MPPTLQALGIDQMSVEDRIALAQAIWDSIIAQPHLPLLTEAQRQELQRRVEDDEANPDDAVPWEQVKAEALARHRSPVAEGPPLREDGSGALRVGGSRVLLELVIQAFQDGAPPETIVQRYSTLSLADVYAVIAYYLRHRQEVEEYLARREQKAEEVRQRMDREQGELAEIRARLLARRNG